MLLNVTCGYTSLRQPGGQSQMQSSVGGSDWGPGRAMEGEHISGFLCCLWEDILVMQTFGLCV